MSEDILENLPSKTIPDLGDIKTDKISDIGENVFIELDPTDINFQSTNLTWNGIALGGGVPNPLNANLDASQFSITNIDIVNTNSIQNQLGSNKIELNTPQIQIGGAINMQENAISNIGGANFTRGIQITELVISDPRTSSNFTIISDTLKTRKSCNRVGGILAGSLITRDDVFADNTVGTNDMVASFLLIGEEDHTASARGTQYSISTNRLGATSINERLRIDGDNTTYINGGLSVSLNSDAATRTEGGLNGVLLKILNSSTLYAGDNAGSVVSSGVGNILLGSNAGSKIQVESNNIAIGDFAIENRRGEFNVAVGVNSQKGNPFTSSTGTRNVSVGTGSLQNAELADSNTCIGHLAGSGFRNSNGNVSIGYETNNNTTNNTSSVNCVAVGTNTSTNGDNQIVLGYQTTATLPNQCTIGNTALVQVVPSTQNLCDLGSTTRQFKDIFANTYKINDKYIIRENADDLIVEHLTGGVVDNTDIFGHSPPIPTKSTVMSNIDYSTMFPNAMISNITSELFNPNKFWGHSAIYIANEALLPGRIVSLANQVVDSDNVNLLKVGYLQLGGAPSPATFPIGVTQGSCEEGEKITLCIRGYTTVVALGAVAHPQRGSMVLPGNNTESGRVRIGAAAAAIEARIGFVAQSNAVAANGPCLIFYSGFFQAT